MTVRPTPSIEKEVIDALLDDFSTNAGLPPYLAVGYRRPRAIMPTDCPVLVVWLENKALNAVSTMKFNSTLTIGVSWHEATIEEAVQVANDPDISASLLYAMKRLERRIMALSVASGQGLLEDLPLGAWQVLPGGSNYQRMEDGLVEGYALVVLVEVSEKAS